MLWSSKNSQKPKNERLFVIPYFRSERNIDAVYFAFADSYSLGYKHTSDDYLSSLVTRRFRIIGFEKLFAKIFAEWQKNAKLSKVPSRFSPSLGENDGKFISTWNLGYSVFGVKQRLEIRRKKMFNHLFGKKDQSQKENTVGDNIKKTGNCSA